VSPSDLQQAIRQLIDIRRQYLGGTLAVLAEEIAGGDLQSPTKNLYVARRQGNGVKDGARALSAPFCGLSAENDSNDYPSFRCRQAV